MRGAAILLGLCGLAGLGPSAAWAAGDSPPGSDPWAVVAEVRDQLRDGSPLAAAFTQSFLPSGFSTGDSESGALYVNLPRCLRFEYLEPFPKNFLLCGDWVYTWNPGDPSGRRFLVTDGEAEGIDLLRLEVDGLRTRYRAEFGGGAPGRDIIRLIPTDETADIREASIELERAGQAPSSGKSRLLALAYEDRSGNRTRFEIADYRKLATKAAFETPALEWLED